MRRIAALILSASLASASAFAAAPVAQVNTLSGKVLVNQGEGFVPATQGLALNAGDRVFVGKDSAASVNYVALNCSLDVAAATVVTINSKAPCAEGQSVAAVDSVFVNAAQAPAAGAGGASYVPIVVPAFVIGVGSVFTFAAIQQHKNKHKPVSTP